MIRHYPLKNHNTFGVDAQADGFLAVTSERDLEELLHFRPPTRMILGAGSNVLFVRDYAGVVIKNALRGIALVAESAATVTLRVAGGESWVELVRYCVDRGWSGIENLALIPGTVGAAPVQNIGAYGVEFQEVVKEVEFCNLRTGEVGRLPRENCDFGYRTSLFKKPAGRDLLVTSVTIELSKHFTPRTHYRDLTHYFAEQRPAELSLKAVYSAVVAIRQRKLPDPEQLGNAGSFFMNPEVAEAEFTELAARFPDLPGFPGGPGRKKISAAWLIEHCGWKGKSLGRAGVYAQHALILVNLGGATGAEILALAEAIQDSVQDRFGLRLQPEVLLV